MGRQAGLFDIEERLRELSAKGDDLERINALVDFEAFRAELERAMPRPSVTSATMSRPPSMVWAPLPPESVSRQVPPKRRSLPEPRINA